MRFVKTGALFGALWLLGGCVPEDSPVAGSKPLSTLNGREVLAMCDWALDYWGGYAPNDPGADEDNPEARHRCPPTQEDLWEGVDTVRYILWNSDECSNFLGELAGLGCNLTVDHFEHIVRSVADEPCIEQRIEVSSCVITYVPDFEE
jgi:hypothetical protein